ncbi:MAG: class I SAM-dependent methyltransferase [Saprospiraceae bacterium]|nr:class I SAM-dependent methyltransferase [Saprospiraceae bacterium]
MHSHTGFLTLESLAKAGRFNRWMYDSIHPWVQSPVLEIGSGIGNISSCLLEEHTDVSLSEFDQTYINTLQKRFQGHPGLKAIMELDLVHPDFDTWYHPLLGRYNSLVATNVLEHICQDEEAIVNALKLLKPGGHFVMLVPAIPALYNRLDSHLGHCRRYRMKEIVSKFRGQNGSIQSVSYFNKTGTLAWLVSGTLLNSKYIKPWQVNLFDKMVPFSKYLETILPLKFGLSILVVFRK